MRSQITIKLTAKQAQALLRAAGNTLGWEGDAINVFNGDRRDMNAAYKAQEIIREALKRTNNSGQETP